MSIGYPTSSTAEAAMLCMVNAMRQKEPRINNGFDLVAYCSIWDDDDIEHEMNDHFSKGV
jgi:hypothetical protein